MNNYKVIEAQYILRLEKEVNDHLKDGWLLSGGVNTTTVVRSCFNGIESWITYSQAIYKIN
jgi:hypothetical protein